MRAEAVTERDWVWVRIGPVPSDTARLTAYGWRRKQGTTHNLPDGTQAVWYHSCQGKWRPTYKKGKGRPWRKKEDKKSMSKADALKFVNSL